ncbi:MAG: PilZ domain-containing protein [Pseudomonadota bacterium]
MAPDEQRRRLRVSFQVDVELHVEGHDTINVTSKDISMKGVFIKTGEKIFQGKPCRVRISLSGASGVPPLDIKGKIARIDSNGVGVDFLEMDPETFTHLRNIVAYNFGDADQVDEEISHSAF